MTGHEVDVVAWAWSLQAATGAELAERLGQQLRVLTGVVEVVEGTRAVLDGPDNEVADAIRQVLWHLDVLISRLSVIRAAIT